MDINSLTSGELYALLVFLEDFFYIDTVSKYEEYLAINLFSAYIKKIELSNNLDQMNGAKLMQIIT